jgi:hypothetical protein
LYPGQELGSFKILKIIYAVVRLLATIARADVTSNPTLPSTNENVQTQIALEHPDVTTSSILPSATDPAIENFDNPKVVAALP